MTKEINRKTFERELKFGPGKMWWYPVMNTLHEIRKEDNFPDNIILCDETLREGEETPGVILDLKDRIIIAKKLEEIGIPEAEIGYAGAIKEHAEFSKKLKNGGTKLKLISHTRIYTKENEWKEEIYRAVEAGSDILCLLASMSETLCATTPWLPKEEVPKRIAESIEYTNSLGVVPALTLVDGIRTPLNDFLYAYKVAANAGVKRIYIMDGQGVALPETVTYLVQKLKEIVGEDIEIAAHFHNDYGLATANTLAAIKAGASVVDVVVNGFGDKAGIAALEEIVMSLEILYGIKTKIDLSNIVALSKLVQKCFNVSVGANKAIVGPNIFRHQIDAHIATILRGYWWAWENVKPEFFGLNRSLEFAQGKLRSGRSGALQVKLESMGFDISDKDYEKINLKLMNELLKKDFINEDGLERLINNTLKIPVE